ncbi:MAG: hypothetical protein BAJATHORv1_60061 [Candidatus Thorarchaeota archaeon]|nr:MAG: hypothetical protein BAJATHORv1_60061 [Candidatus Thorarchaeota archaeon]
MFIFFQNKYHLLRWFTYYGDLINLYKKYCIVALAMFVLPLIVPVSATSIVNHDLYWGVS